MHPVLFEWGPFHLYSYGAFVCLGGIPSCWFLYRRRGLMGLKTEDHFWLLINTLLFSGFIGGRLLHLIEYVPYSSPDFWGQALAFNRGFSVLGAFAGICAGIYAFCRYARAEYPRVLDYICQIAPFWHFFGRLGCLAAGCCYGKPADSKLSWAIVFTDPRSLTPREMMGRPLHPSQLYEGLGDLGIAIFLFLFVLPRLERGGFRPGTLCAAYFMLYGVLRFVTENFRGDTVPLPMAGLTGGQALSLGLIAFAFGLLVVVYNKKACTPS